MGEGVGISHAPLVDFRLCVLAHGDAVAEGEAPWHAEDEVSVFVHADALLPPLLSAPQFGVDVGIVDITLFIQVFVVFLFVLVSLGPVLLVLAPDGIEEFAPSPSSQKVEEGECLLVVDGVRKVLAHALESSETSLAPFRLVADAHVAVFVFLVGIGSEDGVEREGVAFGKFQSYPHVQVAPGACLCRKVVRHVGRKFVDERDFPETGGVAVRLYLHFDVVRDAETDASGLCTVGEAVEQSLVGRVAYGGNFAVGIGLYIGVVVSVAVGGEVRRIGETHLWLEDVAYGLDLSARESFEGFVETVERGVHAQRGAPVVEVVESEDRVAHLALTAGVPVAFNAAYIHDVAKGERRRDVDVLEELESCVYGHAVLHAVPPFCGEV